MADTTQYFNLTIVTPAGTIEEYNIRHLRAPGSEGDFGVLANHLPLVTTLRIGELELDTQERGIQYWAVSGGYVEVLGNKVVVLAENAEPADKINLERAEKAHERAKNRLKNPNPDLDYQRCQLALQRSINRMNVARKSR